MAFIHTVPEIFKGLEKQASMRKIIFFVLPFAVMMDFGCKKANERTNSETGMIAEGPAYIHWGTKCNTLRGLTITWFSPDTDDSIKWGYTDKFESGVYEASCSELYIKYRHEFTFPTLKPESQIHYAVKTGGEWGKGRLFTTSVDTASEIFSFIAGSDSHGGDDDHASDTRWQIMSRLIVNENCDFYLLTGDVVDDNDDWNLWVPHYRNGKKLFENKIVFYSWGNHEYGPIALHNTTLPGNEKWYAFSQGNTLFISLLSEEDFDIQHQWLLDQLIDTNKQWVIVYFHRPFFTRGSHKDEMNDFRSGWWKAFDDHGVDIILSGHTHSYIRTKPLNLNVSDTSAVSEYGSKSGRGRMAFVLGGLGGRNSQASEDWFTAKAYSGVHYVRFDVSRNKLNFKTYSHLGTIIDSLTLYSDN